MLHIMNAYKDQEILQIFIIKLRIPDNTSDTYQERTNLGMLYNLSIKETRLRYAILTYMPRAKDHIGNITIKKLHTINQAFSYSVSDQTIFKP